MHVFAQPVYTTCACFCFLGGTGVWARRHISPWSTAVWRS